MALAFPPAFLDFIGRNPFPARFPGDLYAQFVPGMKGGHYDFCTVERLEINRTNAHRGHWNARCARDPQDLNFWRDYSHFYCDHNTDGPDDLPWLDFGTSVVIAGGADYGDDAEIALDYRMSPTSPRVVGNRIIHLTAAAAHSGLASHECRWVEFAPSVEAFLARIQGHLTPIPANTR